ncbi:hypothetical protein FOB58_003015 [Candida parapsilosis]|uniref:Uncharacterized protein n=2 Tax=Candida parapsilosis TaxID=5480 RepID=G8B783_CANPC|nr:uncharacterized protein CPAR2_103540 [Candida parapsilosis]KAF6048296.1 hypothetical protein FOB59_003338 [Candida parapsilosis]KAF6049738.1 hypothetical protein FOB58_003015 [Candida parapsilosis]KAF6057600.1 hypothetical protein FOB60_002155 [Candida parapsilosis]KAF6065692.1 hypothetical protein FOB61_001762 [Candida parapsilosis]KAI5907531.1 hypothetical protein K4G61_g1192 [Candida parapsilosis]
MSDLYSKLGPQGRALMNKSQYQIHNYSNDPNNQPQDLDFVINELRNPKPTTTVNRVLGYLYNYVPYIKHERNLGIVIASFLNSPVCFGANVPPFEENYLIIEVFKLITDKKLEVSQPTLPIKEFYTVIRKELENFVWYNQSANSWKVLPIICGMMLSNSLRNELYTEANYFQYRWFFDEWDEKMKKLFIRCLEYSLTSSHSEDIVYLSVTSLALVYQRDESVKKYTKHISDGFMVGVLMDMIFLSPRVSILSYHQFFKLNPQDANVSNDVNKQILQKPVIKHLNKFSFLLAAYFSQLKYTHQNEELILTNLTKIADGNKLINHMCANSIFNTFTSAKENNPLFQSFWYFMKNLLFAEVIIFQGIFTRFLTGNKSNFIWFNNRDLIIMQRAYRQIALTTLPSLYYLNFILMSIGQGGFDNYNFVYYLSVELALSTGQHFEQLVLRLFSDYNEINLYSDVLDRNYIMQSKVLFVLGLWENYLQQKPIQNEHYATKIYNLVRDLANDDKYTSNDLIEASHSVLLFYFANSKNVDLADCIQYVNLLTSQFPQRLSSTQLCIAIETIGKKILSNPQPYPENSIFINSADEFFHFLADKCAPIPRGAPIKPTSPSDNPSFASAQPISEIEAHATLNTLEQDNKMENDIIHENKAKKPKDKVVRDLLPRFKREYKFEDRLAPETVREAAVLALINLVPYFPTSLFIPWVERIWDLIVKSNVSEANYLTGMLWKVMSDSLDLNRVELAMRWWYEEKQLSERNYIAAKM